MAFPWEADAKDVAELLPQRTKGEWGAGETREFTEDTTPTLAQVEEVCEKAAKRVARKLRVTEDNDICEDGPIDLAEEAASFRAAMIVELTFFMNQIRTDQSPYEKLKEQYDETMDDLLEAYKDQCGDPDGDGPLGEEMPRGNFPKSRGWGRKRW
jgi:hypothetical protein